MFRQFSLSTAAIFAVALCSMAQDPRASVVGTVLDSSGSVVAGAEVRATKMDTGVVSRGVSNDAGQYNIPFLLPGMYRITVEKPGFKTYSRDNVELRVADALELPIHLELGNTTETVVVTAAPPLLETATSTPGTVIDERRLLELPQKGGDAFELTHFTPGVVNMTNLRTFKPDSPEGTSSISAVGTPTFQTQWQIDGINDTVNDENKGYARVTFIPPSGAIIEFKMQSNPYDASAGHVLGPVVSVNTKSGTNLIHGTMYYWGKNSAFDANDFFTNKAGQPKPVYQDHRYGLTVGGPFWLPKLYNGRNKSFFFFAWEGNRYTSPASTVGQTSTVPTAAERMGDFSALLKLGPQYQIYNPFTTTPLGNGHYQRQPFDGNIIPKDKLNAVGVNLVNLYPLPNQPGTADGESNYFYPDTRRQLSDSFMGRADHSFSENNRMFFRVNHYHYHIPKNVLGVTASTFIEDQINEGAALDDVIVINPTLILNLRYGVTTAAFPEFRATKGTDLTSLGFSPAFASLVDASLSTVPRISVSPFTTLSNWSLGDGNTSGISHSLVADLTKLKGGHSLHFGTDLRLLRTFANRYQTAVSPDLSFSSTYTQGPFDNSQAAPIGQQLAALLLGIPGGSMTSPYTNSYAVQNKYMGLYVQDDIKVSRSLTVNIGLRYELEWPVTERFNRLEAGFDFTTINPINAQAAANYAAIWAKNPIPEVPVSAFAARGGLTFVNQNGKGKNPYRTNSGQWLPRVGLAWQITPKTVLRSGYGIYYGSLGVDSFSPLQTGFSQSTPIQASLDNGVTYAATLTNPFPHGLIPPTGASGGLTTALGQSITFFNPNLKPPYSQRWSFGLQRVLPGEFLIDVTYIGTRVTHLAVLQQFNNTPARYLSTSPVRDPQTIGFLTQTFPNPFFGLSPSYGSTITRATLLEPYPEFGALASFQPIGFSWYHSLQVRIEKRLSKGYTIQVGYTHSKYMQATEFLNPTDPVPYRTISDMDRPNVFTMTGLVELPFGRGRRFGTNLPGPVNAILGEWQLNMTEIHQSGAPLLWGNIIFNGNIKDIQLPDSQQKVERWFNTGAGFNTVSSQQLSNNIRTFPLRFNGIRADGQTQWNFSLLRNYHIVERLTAQFRAEVYNALNHPVFSAPNTTPSSLAFGTVTTPASEPRGWQFALKLVF